MPVYSGDVNTKVEITVLYLYYLSYRPSLFIKIYEEFRHRKEIEKISMIQFI